MVARVTVTGTRLAQLAFEGDIERAIDTEIRTNTLAAFRDVRLATPVDTGNARNSWRVNQVPYRQGNFNLIGQQVENTTNYIQQLNDGSSVQAPARFIETSFLRYFNGVVVEVIEGEL